MINTASLQWYINVLAPHTQLCSFKGLHKHQTNTSHRSRQDGKIYFLAVLGACGGSKEKGVL